MYSKEESARIRKEFWTRFGQTFPRKWLRYNTKIKDLSLNPNYVLEKLLRAEITSNPKAMLYFLI